MKKILFTGLLSLTLSASSSSAAGHIWFNNYIAPAYYPALWYPGGPAVADTTLNFQLFYGEGVQSNPTSLNAGNIAHIYPYNPSSSGWFEGGLQVLPDWQPGDTYTFAIRASTADGLIQYNWSPLWQERDAISSTINPSFPFSNMPQYVLVPEPSSIGLTIVMGFGVILRRCRAR